MSSIKVLAKHNPVKFLGKHGWPSKIIASFRYDKIISDLFINARSMTSYYTQNHELIPETAMHCA